MTEGRSVVPLWTLATKDVELPQILPGEMSQERLAELRTVLAAMADSPIATLEAHPVSRDLEKSRGIHLDSASPLATHLSQLVGLSSKEGPAAAVAAGGEVLYRMVVPAKVAEAVGSGMVKPMASKAVAGGVHSALRTGSSKIAAQATFVPVAGKAAAAGAAGGAAAAGAGALTVAAPLVLMAVAVGVSAHADEKREQAMEKITSLLEQLHDDALDRERAGLNGCRAAIEKATAILLDQGRVGVSLGLDSAVYAIEVALSQAQDRLKKWQDALDEVGDKPVELVTLRETFDGIGEETGTFRAHLELAALATALKRRVIVLQAVEHAQTDPGNPFETFTAELKRDQQRVEELESGIRSVLLRLSTLELDRPRGFRNKIFTSGEVDSLLRASYKLRDLGREARESGGSSDVAIDIARDPDGSLTVFPATAIA